MTELRRRMTEDLKLHGFTESTQQAYIQAVKGLALFYGRSPDKIEDEEIRQYFLHLIQERKVAGNTVKTYLYGIKFFYEKTLGRQWPVFELIRVKKEKKLPVVLSREEVQRILTRIRKPRERMALTLTYSCGLRVSEAAHMKVSHIDFQRQVVRVDQGKGRKDRYVPLPKPTAEMLGAYMRRWNSSSWLFSSYRNPQYPVHTTSLQKAFRAALLECRIDKKASVHTLRHNADSRIMPTLHIEH